MWLWSRLNVLLFVSKMMDIEDQTSLVGTGLLSRWVTLIILCLCFNFGTPVSCLHSLQIVYKVMGADVKLSAVLEQANPCCMIYMCCHVHDFLPSMSWWTTKDMLMSFPGCLKWWSLGAAVWAPQSPASDSTGQRTTWRAEDGELDTLLGGTHLKNCSSDTLFQVSRIFWIWLTNSCSCLLLLQWWSVAPCCTEYE